VNRIYYKKESAGTLRPNGFFADMGMCARKARFLPQNCGGKQKKRRKGS
jgi:hypothetical protein